MNPFALEQMGFDFESDERQLVGFSFDEGVSAVGNITDLADKFQERDMYRVYKNGNIANKELHNFLVGREELGIGEYQLEPMPTDENGITGWNIIPISEETSTETTAEIPAESEDLGW